MILAAGLVGSCATAPSGAQSGAGQAARAAAAPASQWVKVRSNPPTWYPRGTRTDQPTDLKNGEWVHTEDALGSRYFIPVRGIPTERRELLRRQALAARSPRKVSRIAAEDTLRVLRNGTLAVLVLTPPGMLACGAIHGIGPGPGGGPGSISISPGSIGGGCGVGSGVCGP